jgi:hypothetical protein
VALVRARQRDPSFRACGDCLASWILYINFLPRVVRRGEGLARAVAIQITQTFPRCRRCGKMIHLRGRRIRAIGVDGAPVVLCSEICRDEYAERNGLNDRGEWEEAGERR